MKQLYAESQLGMHRAAARFVVHASNGDELQMADVVAGNGRRLSYLIGVQGQDGNWYSFDVREVAGLAAAAEAICVDHPARRTDLTRALVGRIASREALAWSICGVARRISAPE